MPNRLENRLSAFSTTALDLQRGSREQTVATYQNWALSQVKSVIPFDAAFWGGGRGPAHQPAVHFMHLYNLPPHTTALWAQNTHLMRAERQRLIEADSQSLTFNYSEFSRSEGYQSLWKPLGVSHLLSIYLADPLTTLYQCISLYRFAIDRPFAEPDRLLHQALVPHLIEGHRNNRLWHMRATLSDQSHPAAYSGAIDQMGLLHFAEPGFTQLLRLEWPQWQGPELPGPITSLSTSLQPTNRHVGQAIVVTISPLHDLSLVEARPVQAADLLTERLLDVARRFAAGGSHKCIAKELGISPSTVRNQVSTIYERLEVSNKSELALALRASP